MGSWNGQSSGIMATPQAVMNTVARSPAREGFLELDPRRRELLESRMDARFGMGFVQEQHPFGSIPTQKNDSSNMSDGSHHSGENNQDLLQTPEKSRTPSGTERKRKRKNQEMLEQSDS